MSSQKQYKRRKRLDGEGSEPKETRPGVWRPTVMRGYTADGPRDRRTGTASSAAQCRRKLARLVRDYEAGRVATVDGNRTLSAWMDRYLEKRELAEDLEALTLKGCRSKV